MQNQMSSNTQYFFSGCGNDILKSIIKITKIALHVFGRSKMIIHFSFVGLQLDTIDTFICSEVTVSLSLFGFFRPIREFVIHLETPPLPMKGWNFLPLLGTYGH